MYPITYIEWIRQMNATLEAEKEQGFSVGMYPSPPDERDHVLTAVARDLPSKVNLTTYTPFIKDQLKCGTCVAKGTTGIMNANLNFKERLPENGLSTLYLYTRCKQEDNLPNTQGTFPRVALKIAQNEGVCEERLLPYGDCMPLPDLTQEMRENAAQYKIKSYMRLYGLHQIKAALAAGHLVAIGTIVTSENWLEQDGWLTQPRGRLMGQHMTYLDGYDDNLTYDGHRGFLFGVNSWGTGWGMNGRFRMGYDYAQWESSDLPNFPALREAWAVEMGVNLPAALKTVIEMWIGSTDILVDGTKVTLDVAPMLHNERTFVPVRFIAEQFGADVQWIHEERKVIITKKEGQKEA